MFGNKEKSWTSAVKYVLLVAAIVVIGFNQFSISTIETGQSVSQALPIQNTKTSFSYSDSGNSVQSAINAVFYTGQPEWSDGSVSYDDIEGSLTILANIDRAISTDSLSPELKQRYIDIASQISCEYCCTAPSVIFPDGRAACGCSHSFALRGIAKYLLTQYGDSYTNEEILFEMTAWKNLFFPKDTVLKAAALIENGMEITPDALNDPQLLQKIESGDTSSIGQLQGMVGGC